MQVARSGNLLAGICIVMISSVNGTNIVGAAREMREWIEAWNQSDIEQSLAQKQIKWKFNPPGAPHFGGVWERMVRSCKKAMIAIVGNRTLTDDVLSTTMCLVEQILNSRPLTSVSDDSDDLEALTPNHFLLGHASPATPIIPDAQRYTICEEYSEYNKLTQTCFGADGLETTYRNGMRNLNGIKRKLDNWKSLIWFGL